MALQSLYRMHQAAYSPSSSSSLSSLQTAEAKRLIYGDFTGLFCRRSSSRSVRRARGGKQISRTKGLHSNWSKIRATSSVLPNRENKYFGIPSDRSVFDFGCDHQMLGNSSTQSFFFLLLLEARYPVYPAPFALIVAHWLRRVLDELARHTLCNILRILEALAKWIMIKRTKAR